MTGTTATSAAAANIGTTMTSTATCAAGKVLLGGGVLVTSTDSSDKVGTMSSYPSATNVWTGIGVIHMSLGNGKTMSVTAYALCSQ